MTMVVLIILGALLVAFLIFLIATYNNLVQLRQRLQNAWSQVDVQLKRRYDLIPNLVATVQGYAAHEKQVFEDVTTARANVMNATSKGPKETAQAENQFEGALKSLFAVAEAYPDLKANQNFIQLQNELVDTEDKIQASRRFYNGGVRDLNTKIKMFPSNLVAGVLGFHAKEFFEVEDMASVEKPVEVKF